MRKLLSAFHSHGQQHINNLDLNLNLYIPPSSFHASMQHDQIDQYNTNEPIYHISKIPFVETIFDIATLPVIIAVLLLSILSLSFIFHLRFRSRATFQLREFTNLWTVRVLLILFISYWAINEIIRLPFFRRRYLLPFSPTLTLSEQDDLCKLHVVFSLGFLEPGFLIALLYIINESIKDFNRSELKSVLFVLLMTLPTFILQTVSVFVAPLIKQLPSMMIRTSLLTVDDQGNKSMTCTFSLLSSIIFGLFAIVYSVGLIVCCCRVVSMVINKKIRLRINLLGFTVIISLLVQSICLGVESYWTPISVWYSGVLLGMFVSLAMCAGVAEIVLVIKPILEALVAGGDNCEWNPVARYLQGRNL